MKINGFTKAIVYFIECEAGTFQIGHTIIFYFCYSKYHFDVDFWETENDLYEDEIQQHLYCLIKQHARQRKSPIKAFDPKLLRTPTIQRLL